MYIIGRMEPCLTKLKDHFELAALYSDGDLLMITDWQIFTWEESDFPKSYKYRTKEDDQSKIFERSHLNLLLAWTQTPLSSWRCLTRSMPKVSVRVSSTRSSTYIVVVLLSLHFFFFSDSLKLAYEVQFSECICNSEIYN